MSDLRVFLAHDRHDPDEDIDAWRDIITDQIEEKVREEFPDEDITVTVVPGRDDFNRRKSDEGGWKNWQRSVIHGTLWDGTQRFHQYVRPARHVHGDSVDVGRSTFDMFDEALSLGKDGYVWDVNEQNFVQVVSCERLPGDSYQTWGRLVLEEER